MEDIFQKAPISYTIITTDGEIILANQYSYHFFSYEEKNFIGKNMREFCADKAEIFRFNEIIETLKEAADENIVSRPLRLRCGDGKIIGEYVDTKLNIIIFKDMI